MVLTSRARDALDEQLRASITGPVPSGSRRSVPGHLELPGKATAIVGMRRAGKTYFVHQLRTERMMAGRPQSSLPYVNFEDERLAALAADDLGHLVDEHARLVAAAAGPIDTVTWCLDEIQNVVGWERFVRRLLDRAKTEVIVTGSSAALLSREIATALRGRAWTVPMFPFSFGESLVHRFVEPPSYRASTARDEHLRFEGLFREWLREGGFPEAQGLDAEARGQLLRDYVDVAILRDVVERHAVTNVVALRWLVRQLLGNAGSLFSVEKFHAALRSQGIAVGKDTVHELLAHLEDCFLVRTVWMESASERQRMVNPRKAYPVDMGLIPIFDRTGRANLGHALETAVLIELQRRRCEVTYVRTASGREVDFLARDFAGNATLIQVCADASDAETGRREIEALEEAATAHPRARCLLLTATADGAPSAVPNGIECVPAYAWMLS